MKRKPTKDEVAIQCCPTHWAMMETALEERGMGELISPSNTEAAKRLANACDQDDYKAVNDPLLESFMLMAVQIMGNGIPEEVLNNLKGKEICPVCIAMALTKGHTPESTEQHWTTGLADHMAGVYRGRGSLPRLQ